MKYHSETPERSELSGEAGREGWRDECGGAVSLCSPRKSKQKHETKTGLYVITGGPIYQMLKCTTSSFLWKSTITAAESLHFSQYSQDFYHPIQLKKSIILITVESTTKIRFPSTCCPQNIYTNKKPLRHNGDIQTYQDSPSNWLATQKQKNSRRFLPFPWLSDSWGPALVAPASPLRPSRTRTGPLHRYYCIVPKDASENKRHDW